MYGGQRLSLAQFNSPLPHLDAHLQNAALSLSTPRNSGNSLTTGVTMTAIRASGRAAENHAWRLSWMCGRLGHHHGSALQLSCGSPD